MSGKFRKVTHKDINRYGKPSYVKVLTRGEDPYPTIMRSARGDSIYAEMYQFPCRKWTRYFDLWEDEVYCGSEGIDFEYLSEEEIVYIIGDESCLFTEEDLKDVPPYYG